MPSQSLTPCSPAADAHSEPIKPTPSLKELAYDRYKSIINFDNKSNINARQNRKIALAWLKIDGYSKLSKPFKPEKENSKQKETFPFPLSLYFSFDMFHSI